MTWQPIETAPNDGTEVLVFGQFAGEISGPHSEREYGIACYTSGRTDYEGFEWCVLGGDYYATWCNPTHWQPLPAPPESAA